jgi:hypothetical protein
MSRGDKWVIRIGTAMIVAVVSAIAIFWFTGWPLVDSYVPPALAGMDCASDTNCSAASRRFSDRIHAKYPIGSKQDILDRDLTAQRFKPMYRGITHCTKPGEVDKIGVTAVRCPAYDINWNPQQALMYWNCRAATICNHYAAVSWSSDAVGRITYLHAGITVTRGS